MSAQQLRARFARSRGRRLPLRDRRSPLCVSRSNRPQDSHLKLCTTAGGAEGLGSMRSSRIGVRHWAHSGARTFRPNDRIASTCFLRGSRSARSGFISRTPKRSVRNQKLNAGPIKNVPGHSKIYACWRGTRRPSSRYLAAILRANSCETRPHAYIWYDYAYDSDHRCARYL